MEESRIKYYRKLRKLTQVQLAEALGVTQGAVQKLESGIADLDTTWMRKLAEVLHVKPYELLPLDMQPNDDITPEEKEILRMIRKSKEADNSAPPSTPKAG